MKVKVSIRKNQPKEYIASQSNRAIEATKLVRDTIAVWDQ